ncbi:hypothetical protein LG299_09080 [Microbacterium lacus]|uniref:hypothetical protein n=1 Tax=Microbacterium lacus TaxID=415217 RepID=UPI00384CAC5E
MLGLSGVLGTLGSAVRAAVVDAVAQAPEQERAAIFTLPAATDSQAQAVAAEALFARLFGESLRVTELTPTDGGALRWEFVVDPERLDPWGIPPLADDLDNLDREARDVDGLAPQGSSVDGGLAQTLETSAEGVRAVQAVVPVPLALIAIGGLIAALQLARLLGDSRIGEAALLRARGLRPTTARWSAIGEVSIIATVGAGVGWLLAAGAVGVFAGGGLSALRATGVVPVVVAAALGLGAGLAAWHASEPKATESAGRSRTAVTGLSAALLTLAAAVALWQLRGVAEAGSAPADVWSFSVTAVAPALALAAASVLVLAFFGLAAELASRVAARRPALAPALPARMVARYLPAYGVVVALIALAAGGAVVAGASVATWSRVGEENAALRAGAEGRAVVGAEQVTAAQVSEVTDATDVDAAAAVVTRPGVVSDVEVSMIAIADSAVAQVVSSLPDLGIDPDQIAAQLAHDPAGKELPEGAGRLEATFAVQGNLVGTWVFEDENGTEPPVRVESMALPTADQLEATAWLVDDLGTPARVPLALEVEVLDGFAGTAVLRADAALPAGRSPWVLVGMQVGFGNAPGTLAPSLTPTTLTVGDGSELEWPSTAPLPLGGQGGSQTTEITFAPVPAALPAVVSTTLADAFGMEIGDSYDLRLERSSRVIPLTVTGIVAAVPGASRDAALMVPLGAFTQSQVAASGSALSADQVWADGAGAVSALGEAFTPAAVDTAAPNTALTASLAATWWVATSIGGVLAAVAIAAAAVALARRRSTDVFVLRALGRTAAAQSRARLGELAAVALFAVFLGALLGAAIAWLTLPALTLAAVPGVSLALTNTLVWGWAPPVVLVIIIALAVGAASVIVTRLMRVQSRAGRVREAS